MGNWWRRFREWDNKGLLIERVDGDLGITKGGYVFDRRVFRTYLILVFAVVAYILYVSNVGHQELYVTCPGPLACKNEFYHNCDTAFCARIVEQEFLPPGFILGTPPNQEFQQRIKGLLIMIVSGFLVACSANHYLHNKGKKLDAILNMEES